MSPPGHWWRSRARRVPWVRHLGPHGSPGRCLSLCVPKGHPGRGVGRSPRTSDVSPAQGVPAGCGNNGTSFEDDLTLGAEGTGHPWVSPPAMSLSPHDQRQGGGDAATIPHFGGMSPGSVSPLWQQGRTSVSTPPCHSCPLSAPFSQPFCYWGATRLQAGELWGPGGFGDIVPFSQPCCPPEPRGTNPPVWPPVASPASPPRPVAGRSWGGA